MGLLHKCDGCQYKSEHQEMGFKSFGVCTKYTNLIEAQRAYEAEKCPCQNSNPDSDRLPSIQEMQSDEKIRKGIALLFEGLSEIIKNIASAFIASGVNIVEWNEFIETYSNRKVVHLAYHASKDRIRKKNMARLRNDYYKK